MPKKFQVDTGGTLTTDLKAYYKMENANDFYVNAYNLTETGSPVYQTAVITNGLQLGSSNTTKYNSVANDMGITSGSCSMVGWVKFGTIDGNRQVFAMHGDSGTFVRYILRATSTDFTLQRDKEGVGEQNAVYSATVSADTWYHVGGTYDTINARIYVTGTLRATTAASGNGSGGGFEGVVFGVQDAGANFFAKAILDEWGVWNKKLGTAEFVDLYNAGSGQTMVSVEEGGIIMASLAFR